MTKHPFTISAVSLLLLITLTAAVGCSSTKSGADATAGPVRLIKATAQDWVAGIQGGGSGTELTFVVAIDQDDIRFSSIGLADAQHDPVLARPGSVLSNEPVVPKKGDTLHLRLSLEKNDPAANATEAIIAYTVAGEAKTLQVPSIEKIAPQPRP